jgi:PhzF family phenazine biosynthesis protein
MLLPVYQVDAFTDQLFAGNPAAVCPLDSWLSDELMQQIAMENNLAETAFVVANNNGYDIRWFTPAVEVDLCGHATLASAYVLFEKLGVAGNEIAFHSHRSGPLHVKRSGDWLLLDFPADALQPIEVTADMQACFDKTIIAAVKGKTDFMLIMENEADILQVVPRLDQIAQLPARGVIITSRGSDSDFVSRFFGPAVGVPEDPVTGSAHTSLVPYWAKELGKTDLTARQLSARGGFLRCRHLGERVEIGGKGRLFLEGNIYID